jgi:EamA domain-containing membrane protein RarD
VGPRAGLDSEITTGMLLKCVTSEWWAIMKIYWFLLFLKPKRQIIHHSFFNMSELLTVLQCNFQWHKGDSVETPLSIVAGE